MKSRRFAFEEISVPPLPAKPRARAMTCVLDKGLGTAAVDDLVAVSGAWIDLVKLGWGTSRLMDEQVLADKIARYRAAAIDVSTGGTFLEVAFVQRRVDAFLASAQRLGFNTIEVSNGVAPMTPGDKAHLIATARAAGFQVFSEVGRKDPEDDARISPEERIDLIAGELAAGARKVILEGRESGTVGIYDAKGDPAEELLFRIDERFGIEQVVYEAPRKSQQLWLIREFGAEVNLGNIPPEDALAVATLRTGLRGDTFGDIHLRGVDVHVELGINGALAARERGGVVVVVDALRASATIVTALAAGMSSVKPVARVDECHGEVTAGERGGRKIAHARHGNSPTELLRHDYRGKQLVLTTTNAIECILAADGPQTTVLVATTLNASSAARAALALAKPNGAPITLLMAGRNQLEAPEDAIGAAAILDAMGAAAKLHGLRPRASSAVEADFFESASGRNLTALGYADDVRFCAQRDIYDVVPVLRDGRIVPLAE